MLTLSGKHQLLNSIPNVWASVHSSYPAEAGSGELAGGGYQRQPLTLASASDGRREIGSNPVLSIPPGSQVRFIGYWASQTAGVFLGFVPIGGKDYQYTLTSDLFTLWAPGITLSNNDPIVFFRFAPGLVMGEPFYYARDVNGGFFRVSSTPGGAALPLSYPVGRGTVARSLTLALPSGGQITVNESTLDMGVQSPNAAPVWSPQNSVGLDVGATFNLNTLASDPEGQPLTYSFNPASNPAGGLFSLNSTTGVISGLAGGTVTVIIDADDGQA